MSRPLPFVYPNSIRPLHMSNSTAIKMLAQLADDLECVVEEVRKQLGCELAVEIMPTLTNLLARVATAEMFLREHTCEYMLGNPMVKGPCKVCKYLIELNSQNEGDNRNA